MLLLVLLLLLLQLLLLLLALHLLLRLLKRVSGPAGGSAAVVGCGRRLLISFPPKWRVRGEKLASMGVDVPDRSPHRLKLPRRLIAESLHLRQTARRVPPRRCLRHAILIAAQTLRCRRGPGRCRRELWPRGKRGRVARWRCVRRVRSGRCPFGSGAVFRPRRPLCQPPSLSLPVARADVIGDADFTLLRPVPAVRPL